MATITDFLNQMNEVGVFSYVLPFLLIFAVVYAILEKTRIFKTVDKDDKNKIIGDNKGISAIIAVAIGLLALQFDGVSIFFARIFPNVGVGIGIILGLLILVGLAGGTVQGKGTKAIGWIVAIAAILWAVFNWGNIFGGGYSGFGGYWFQEYFWAIVWVIIIIGVILLIVQPWKNSNQQTQTRSSSSGRD